MPQSGVDHLTQGVQSAQIGIGFDGAVGGGRGIGGDAQGAKHQFDAVKVEAVTHRDASAQMPPAEEQGHGPDALVGGQAASVRQDPGFGHTPLDQVVAPHAGLGKLWVASAAPGGDEQGGEAVLFEIKGVIQAGFEDGGRDAVILRGAENDKGVGRAGFVAPGLLADGEIKRPLRIAEG